MLKRLVLLVLVSASGACALPTRDNPVDPVNAPVAAFSVIDASDGNGQCLTVGTAGFPSVVAASRGRCLALDARDSEDPQGDTLWFEYSVIRADGSRDVVGDWTVDRVLVLDSAARFALPVGEPVRFVVDVSTEEGGEVYSSAEQDFVAFNARPVAVADPPRTLPVGGQPWAPGEPFQVQFLGTGSSDPDGDPLTYCWQFQDEPAPICRDRADHADFLRSIPVEPGAWVAELVVRDPSEDSLPSSAHVSITEMPTWAYVPVVSTVPGIVTQLDGEQTVLAGASYQNAPAGVHLSVAGIQRFLIWYPQDAVIRSYDAQTGALADADIGLPVFVSTGNSAHPTIAADDLRDALWTIEYCNCGTPGTRVKRWSVSAVEPFTATLDGDSGVLPLVSGPNVGSNNVHRRTVLVVDSAGNGWAASHGDDSVFRVEPDGTTLEIVIGEPVLGMDARPGSPEVWVLAGIVGDTISIHRLTASGESDVSEIGGIRSAGAFGWVDRATFWMSSYDLGLARFDAESIRAGASAASASLVAVPEIWDAVLPLAPAFKVDRSSGSIWISTGVGAAHVSKEGVVREEPLYLVPFGVDPRGRLWGARDTGSGMEGFLGRTARPGADLLQFAAQVVQPIAFDGPTGGAWLLIDDPRVLQRLGPDGSRRASFDRFERDGAEVAMPSFARDSFHVAPGGGFAWAFEATGPGYSDPPGALLEIDLEASPPTIREILSESQVLALAPDVSPQLTLEISAEAGPPSFAWVVLGTNGRVSTISSTGGVTPLWQVPTGEQMFGQVYYQATRSAWSNRLCIAVADDSTDRVRIRLVDPDPMVPVLEIGQIPIVGFLLDLMVAISDDGTDTCWVGVTSGDFSGTPPYETAIGGFLPQTGTTPDTAYSYPYDVFSLRAPTANQVWLSAREGGSDPSLAVQVNFHPTTRVVTQELEFVSIDTWNFVSR